MINGIINIVSKVFCIGYMRKRRGGEAMLITRGGMGCSVLMWFSVLSFLIFKVI